VRRDTAARGAAVKGIASDAEGGSTEREQVVGALTAKGPDDFGAAQVDANHYIPCAVPFCATSFAKYETGVGTLRREGGDLGGGSETLLCCTAVDQTAYSIREDAKANTFSATPLEASTAIQSLQPSPQSHHAQVFIAQQNAVATRMTVRRLTPIEAERLQGFQDGYTQIPWRGKPASECPDGPRYKALGNSMAVNCMEWIGERIAAQEAA
jgi:DNA (cytosine-5)-methyltransferase 1